MKHDMNRLSLAVRLALTAGVLGMIGAAQAEEPAGQDASEASQAAPPQTSEARTLEGVVVTGSLIRRVDLETASPVVTLDRAVIAATGKPTLGDVLQQLPSISGKATNPQANSNGGGAAGPNEEAGDGASRVSLRGLGVERTLVLVNGQRMANADLNLIPQNMIERTDVLAEGASTVYGSDAIGGVVNFILRKDFSGVQFSLNDGISSHGDSQRHGMNLTVGKTGTKYNIVGGVDYNKYLPSLNTRRKYTNEVLYLSNGAVVQSGSSSIPNGRIQLPASVANRYGCSINSTGTTYVTRFQGDGQSLDDYRCYRGAADNYNYQSETYLQTAQERTNGFVLGSYNLTGNLTAFVNAFYNHTVSSGQDASVPLTTSGLDILSRNPINPFGVTFSQNPIPGDPESGYRFQTRLTGVGPRRHNFRTDSGQINGGLRGNFGLDSSWTWDASVNYSHTNRNVAEPGNLVSSRVQEAVTDGANIFNQGDPAVSELISSTAKQTPVYVLTRATKEARFETGGELWSLPAGTMQLSAGTLFRKQLMNYTVTPGSILDPETNTCEVGGCQSPGRGSFNVKELYAETLIPLVSDQPWAHSLNLDLGIRTSDYSTSGATTNKKIAVEWKPIADLLVRGTISEVFRAPNLNMLYDGLSTSSPGMNDPCAHQTAAELAQHAAACQYVPVNWSGNAIFQTDLRTSGSVAAGSKLKPEQGKSIDIGLVYDPSWISGLSSSIDFWHIYLFDTLTTIAGTTVMDSCWNNNASPYCPFIHRYDSTTRRPGEIFYISTPAVNLGSLSTSGIDYTLRYSIPHFNLGSLDPGNFRIGLNTSYTSTYKNSPTPGLPGAKSTDYAGTFSQQFGNLARWRGTLTLNWTHGNWNAQAQSRYINHVTEKNADAVIPGVDIKMASVIYHSLQFGYVIPAIGTRFDIGVDNLADKSPPLSYQNNMLSTVNTDTNTYDMYGRYYWARATVQF